MNNGFSGPALAGRCHPKGQGGWPPKRTARGCGAMCQTHRSAVGLACGGCDAEVTKGTWWAS